MKNQNIVIMNQFEVPLSSESDFLEFFKTHIKLIASQDGNLECRLFKNTNDENSLNYTSIVCWQNQEAMEKAAANINQASEKAGIDIV
ncbi:MAG: hypothetical protein CSA15_13390, partial [Candidatus Delongbacteria bacterium]